VADWNLKPLKYYKSKDTPFPLSILGKDETLPKLVVNWQKTDRIDAAVLAHFGEAMQLAITVLSSVNEQALQEAVTRRHQLVEMLTVKKNRQSSLHLRVSTVDKGQDTDNQLLQLQEFCDRQGWQIIETY